MTDAVKLAVGRELGRKGGADMSARIRELQAEVARAGRSGLKADKAFFDELSGDGD